MVVTWKLQKSSKEGDEFIYRGDLHNKLENNEFELLMVVARNVV
jgi:hypothetical protein